jgi:DNA-binding LacI/PurR family transcriptional regulator
MTRLGLAGQIRIAPGDFTEEGGYAGARKLLAANPPTAVFASNDLAALGALTAIEEAGLKVPDEMSLVGYDNTSLAALRQISLTTIDQPRREIGAMAMKALLRRIENPKARARRVVLPAQLVVRRTTGAPAPDLKNEGRAVAGERAPAPPREQRPAAAR